MTKYRPHALLAALSTGALLATLLAPLSAQAATDRVIANKAGQPGIGVCRVALVSGACPAAYYKVLPAGSNTKAAFGWADAAAYYSGPGWAGSISPAGPFDEGPRWFSQAACACAYTVTVRRVTTLSLGTVSSTAVTLNWTGITGATGYVVGRDGTDSGGHGPWSVTDPASARSRTFDKLRSATTYTLFVEPGPGGPRKSISVRTAAVSSPPPPPTTAGSWVSGASGYGASDGRFGAWRGSPVESVNSWKDSPASTWNDSTLTFVGELDLGLGPVSQGNPGCPTTQNIANPFWTRAARGDYDATFRAQFAKLAQLRAGKGATYVRPFWEYNGDWYTWCTHAADAPNFRATWTRVRNIQKAEFPEAKLMVGAIATYGGSRAAVSQILPASTTEWDVLSVDTYNQYPHADTRTEFDSKINSADGPNSLEDLRVLAEANGKPVYVSEWANNSYTSGSGGGGQAPEYFTAFYQWMSSHAGIGRGQVIGENNFNFYDHDTVHSFWLLNGSGANGVDAARYKELWDVN